MTPPRLARGTLLGLLLGGAGCVPAPRDGSPSHGTTERSLMDGTTDPHADPVVQLVGSWRKDAATEAPAACAAQYPVTLRFEASGLYRGTPEPPGQFAIWDVGTWRVDGAELAISTATDAVVRYRFTLAGDALQIVDPAGCGFGYRRGA